MALRLAIVAALLLAASSAPPRPPRKGSLLPPHVDPQIDDDALGVEWVPPAELRERMKAHKGYKEPPQQAQQQNAPAAMSKVQLAGYGGVNGAHAKQFTPAERERVAESVRNAARARALQQEVTISTDTGPRYPVWEEDLPYNLTETFATPPTNVRDDGRNPVPLPSIEGCDETAVVDCGKNLSTCLGKNVDSRGAICGCYLEHGRCYTRPGCVELLPRDHVQFCFTQFMCTYDLCIGNGAGRLGLFSSLGGVVAVAAVVMASALLAWQAR